MGRIDAGLGGEFGDHFLVTGDIIEHAGQETRFGAGGTNLGRSDTGNGEKPPQALRIARNVGKRLNCKRFCDFDR